MWIIQEPKKVTFWNKQHFEEKNGECAACLKYSVLILKKKKYIKCNIWRVAVCPSYIQDARFLKVKEMRGSVASGTPCLILLFITILLLTVSYPLNSLLLFCSLKILFRFSSSIINYWLILLRGRCFYNWSRIRLWVLVAKLLLPPVYDPSHCRHYHHFKSCNRQERLLSLVSC
jgi:hypothetical protein